MTVTDIEPSLAHPTKVLSPVTLKYPGPIVTAYDEKEKYIIILSKVRLLSRI